MDEGARQEFAEFVAGRSTRLIRLAYVLTGDQHAAEDLLQNALVKAAARVHQFHGEDLLEIRLTPADSRQFATLTRKLARMPSPHHVLATIIGGQIVDHPVVIRAVTTRWVGFTGFPNRAAAEFALQTLLAGSRP